VDDGDTVLLVGDDGVLGASEYLGRAEGAPREVDVAREVAAIEMVLAAAEEGILQSAHDVSGGGLAVALAESAIAGGRGAEVTLERGRRADEALFGEGGGRMLLTVREADLGRASELARERGVALRELGRVGGRELVARIGGREARLALDAARAAYEGGLPGALA
jgi:phosphoribosylformylglycinamidine synthase